MSRPRRPGACLSALLASLVLWAGDLGAGANLEAGQLAYMLECQGCHLADGSGAPGRVPALRGSVASFLRVPAGREYLVRVPGSAQSPLSDAELAAALNWLLREYGPRQALEDFEPYTAAEVAQHRVRPLIDAGKVREQLIRAIRLSAGD